MQILNNVQNKQEGACSLLQLVAAVIGNVGAQRRC